MKFIFSQISKYLQKEQHQIPLTKFHLLDYDGSSRSYMVLNTHDSETKSPFSHIYELRFTKALSLLSFIY